MLGNGPGFFTGGCTFAPCDSVLENSNGSVAKFPGLLLCSRGVEVRLPSGPSGLSHEIEWKTEYSLGMAPRMGWGCCSLVSTLDIQNKKCMELLRQQHVSDMPSRRGVNQQVSMDHVC